MRKIIVALVCASFVGTPAAELVEVKLTPGEPIKRRLGAVPGKFAELCSVLQRGQVVSWKFRADPATDFNIHYHLGNKVEYPERRKQVRVANGRLTANIDQTYCWMWTNHSGAQVAIDVTLQMR